MRAHKVLVVEDEREMQKALEAVLKGCGLQVATADDGLHAMAKFRQDLYDLVIADVKMPRMSGIELLKEIKRISPLTPVVLLTAYGTVGGAVSAMKEGAFDYLEKPFSPEVLEEVVRRALASKSDEGRKRTRTIITQDPKMLELLEVARTVASSPAPVLITGESGTGKELLARYIHEQSPRRSRPFVAVNCAALPEGLLETELFGHERGSFTGAVAQKKGKFELAHKGTLLLDEVSEMPLALQAKILRALQEGEIDRVGGTRPVAVDVRVIATTNRDLVEEVRKGRFREDLFFRLNVVPLHLPPLRERREDIRLLAEFFLRKYAHLNGKQFEGFSRETLDLLEDYPWPGNVRELENVVHRAVLLSRGPVIEPKDLVMDDGLNLRSEPPVGPGTSLREMERWLILETLKKVGGNRTQAARLLGVSVRTIRNKLREYGLSGKDLAQ